MLYQERKVYTTDVLANTILARDLMHDNGQLILPRGTEITLSQIVRLKQLGIIELWVRDQEDISQVQVDPKTMHLYESTVSVVENLFKSARGAEKIDIDMTAQMLQELANACQKERNFLNLMVNLRTFDEYTFQHSLGVGLLMSKIGEWMGLSNRDCKELLLAGTLHDIGKCMVDEQILQKPGRLTVEEYEHIKQHASFGYMILNKAGVSERVAAVALNHHERIDGGGYPRGIKGREIDLFSRIAAVADVFNAMTSRRVYRDAISHYKVLEEVQVNAFGELDPMIVTIFMQKMTQYLVGNTVGLNDGTIGTVVLIPTDRPTRPLLRTANGFVDLMKRPDLYIEQVVAV